jgi:hypothetical protein
LLGLTPHLKADEVSEQELRHLVSSHEELTPGERRVLTERAFASHRLTPRSTRVKVADSIANKEGQSRDH